MFRARFTLALVVGLAAGIVNADRLGVGCYGLGWEGGPGGTLLDVARHDWVMVLFPQAKDELVSRMNACFDLNPGMRVILRLWFRATYRHPSDGKGAARRPVRFLDYLYCAEARTAFLEQAFGQVDLVLKNASRPENVYGFTFFQDQPGPLAPAGLINETGPDVKPDDWLAGFAPQYEAETGRKMTYWDRDLRIWWSRKFAAALRDMYGAVKARYPRLKGFTHFVNCSPCDFLEAGEDVHSPRTIACRYSDIIGPGGADGFYACRQNGYWLRKYRALAESLDCLYFMQLSHTGNKRLTDWPESVAIAGDPNPHNLGYFIYDGDFVSGAWNDDPDLRPEDAPAYAGYWSRTRRFLARAGVGVDVVRRHLKPEVMMCHAAGEIAVGDVGYVTAEVVNPRTEEWFADPSEARLRNVRVRLSCPDSFSVTDRYSVPTEVVIPELAPGARRTVGWWAHRDRATAPGEPLPFAVEVTCDGVEPARAASEGPVCRPDPSAPLRVTQSGETVRYRNWEMGAGRQPVEISLKHRRRSHASVIDPFFECRGGRIGWRGEVPEGATLTIRPDRTATLTDAKGAVTDVSAGVLGRPFQLRRGRSEILYTDNGGASAGGWKAEIALRVLEPARGKREKGD